jgi:hypothetical protein
MLLKLPLMLLFLPPIVPLLLPSEKDDDFEFEDVCPVLAVARDIAVLSSLWNCCKDFGAATGSLRFRHSRMCGSKEPIDVSVPVLQWEICCPMIV